MKPIKYILYILLFCVCCENAIAIVDNDFKLVPNPKAGDANAFVSNPDGILSSETVRALNAKFYELEKETSAEIAVVVLNSIGNQVLEDFANALFNYWGIGKAGSDNGVLILFVLDQRAIRFEVGYGLEGALPDAICKRIQTQAMLPEFRVENYDAGMMAGVDIMIKLIKEEPVPELESDFNFLNIFIWSTILTFVLFALLPWLWLSNKSKSIISDKKHQTNNNRYTTFKSQKKSTQSCLYVLLFPTLPFFLLIAASIFYWKALLLLLPLIVALVFVNVWSKRKMKKMRKMPIPCKVCSETMYPVPKTENSRILNSSQQFEEQLRSVEYDVFKCKICKKEEVFKYESSSGKYSVCSKCGTKASVVKSKKTVRRANYSSTGLQNVEYACLFCQHAETKEKVIPRLQTTSAGGSSGSRSSSGSFGGGRSGGGGSSSRW
jgi:uncharacterized protein